MLFKDSLVKQRGITWKVLRALFGFEFMAGVSGAVLAQFLPLGSFHVAQQRASRGGKRTVCVCSSNVEHNIFI